MGHVCGDQARRTPTTWAASFGRLSGDSLGCAIELLAGTDGTVMVNLSTVRAGVRCSRRGDAGKQWNELVGMCGGEDRGS